MPNPLPANPPRGALRALAPLIAVQFACWCAMFLTWVGAYPLITTAILNIPPGNPQALRRGVLIMSGCFCWYATLAACLSFAIPALSRRIDAPTLLAASTACGAVGLAGLGFVHQPAMLIPCFSALAVGWCGLSNLTYKIAGHLLGDANMEHGFRVFALSAVLPQLAVTLALALFVGEITAMTARGIMFAAGAAMLTGSAITLSMRKRLSAGNA